MATQRVPKETVEQYARLRARGFNYCQALRAIAHHRIADQDVPVFVLDELGNAARVERNEWERWFRENAVPPIAHDTIRPVDAEVREVLTVFVGVDPEYAGGTAPPQLWSTLCVTAPLNLEQRGYSSQDDARRGHASIVERFRRETRLDRSE